MVVAGRALVEYYRALRGRSLLRLGVQFPPTQGAPCWLWHVPHYCGIVKFQVDVHDGRFLFYGLFGLWHGLLKGIDLVYAKAFTSLALLLKFLVEPFLFFPSRFPAHLYHPKHRRRPLRVPVVVTPRLPALCLRVPCFP